MCVCVCVSRFLYRFVNSIFVKQKFLSSSTYDKLGRFKFNYRWMVSQAGLFNFGVLTSVREKTLNLYLLNSAKRIDFMSHPTLVEEWSTNPSISLIIYNSISLSQHVYIYIYIYEMCACQFMYYSVYSCLHTGCSWFIIINNECPSDDIKQSHGEVRALRNVEYPFINIALRSTVDAVVTPDSFLSISQMELFDT